MKKFAILLLAVLLAACSSPATPTQQAVAPTVVEPSATPVVVVQTVVVQASPLPTEVPSATPIPPTPVPPTAQQPVVVTVVVQATEQASAAQPTQASGNAPITIDTALGRGVFTSMTMSSSNLTLRCSPRDITFNITTPNIDIKDVMFYYRIVDAKHLYPSEWKAFGKMTANGNGNFTLTFKGEDVHPDIRLDGSFFDFQFVGLSKTGDVIDRSEKITDQVKYTLDCP